ncbi:unnamed protein product [Zymoseptoria tritici ST99CH_1E4]|uniref:Uncharacterized protein n=1 Tax=Zymoseptoria tritici ST99CH_1E4 TaxID=1276532 RepID=A0A2H1FJN3_ZYMTR|nr:unnamed protein product [Zymoseptoria tritici ST99CH_1E4]
MAPILVTSPDAVEAILPPGPIRDQGRWVTQQAVQLQQLEQTPAVAHANASYLLFGVALLREMESGAATHLTPAQITPIIPPHSGATMNTPTATMPQVHPSQDYHLPEDATSPPRDEPVQKLDARSPPPHTQPVQPATSTPARVQPTASASPPTEKPVDKSDPRPTPSLHQQEPASTSTSNIPHSKASFPETQPGPLRKIDLSFADMTRRGGKPGPLPQDWQLPQEHRDVQGKDNRERMQADGRKIWSDYNKSQQIGLNRLAFDHAIHWPKNRPCNDMGHLYFGPEAKELEAYIEEDSSGRPHLSMDHARLTWHPRLRDSPQEHKQYMEDHGLNMICTSCLRENKTCDHAWPCSSCKSSENPDEKCQYAYSPSSFRSCKYGMRCHDAHKEAVTFFNVSTAYYHEPESQFLHEGCVLKPTAETRPEDREPTSNNDSSSGGGIVEAPARVSPPFPARTVENRTASHKAAAPSTPQPMSFPSSTSRLMSASSKAVKPATSKTTASKSSTSKPQAPKPSTSQPKSFPARSEGPKIASYQGMEAPSWDT